MTDEINEEWLEQFAKLRNKKERNGGMKFDRILDYLEEVGYDNILAWEDVEAVERNLDDRTRIKPGEFSAIKQAIFAISQQQQQPQQPPAASTENKEMDINVGPTPPPPDDPLRVVPLLYPNNAEWNSETGRLTVDANKPRNSLAVNPEALEFIASIREKIGVISICGKARTGKSLIAGELAAPKERPCPFDLGHYAAACTYGVWIGLRPVPHPTLEDTVILVLDVEGTSFHDADPKSDYQLMVVTLLISSLLIYNVQKTFDGSSLDEIEFILELSSKIACRRGTDKADSDTHILSLFFPVFVWLVRDAHLSFEVDEETKNARDYFFNKILKPPQRGYSSAATRRAVIKRAFQEFFPSFDAFTLPPPAADQRLYGKLGTHPLERINPEFARQVEEVVTALRGEIPVKKMITDVEKEICVTCNGAFLARWIEQCVEQVNSGVPNIESIGQSVFRNRIEESCQKSIETYRKQIDWKVNGLRHGETEPLKTSQILEVHRDILQNILYQHGVGRELIAVDDIDSELSEFRAERLQFFYDTIGHEDVDIQEQEVDDDDGKEGEPGSENVEEPPQRPTRTANYDTEQINSFIPQKNGILQEKIRENNDLCTRFCETWLEEKYGRITEMIENPSGNSLASVLGAFDSLQGEYFELHVNGEQVHGDVWKTFEKVQWKRDQAAFRQYQDYDAKLVEERSRIAQLNANIEQEKSKREEMKRRHDEQQRTMNDQMNRQREEMERQRNENARQLRNLQKNLDGKTKEHKDEMKRLNNQRMQDMRDAQSRFDRRLTEMQKRERETRRNEMETQRKQMQATIDGLNTSMQQKQNEYNASMRKNEYIAKMTNTEREIYRAALAHNWNARRIWENVPAAQEYSLWVLKRAEEYCYTWCICYSDKFLRISVPGEAYTILGVWHDCYCRQDRDPDRERRDFLSSRYFVEGTSCSDLREQVKDMCEAAGKSRTCLILKQSAYYSERYWGYEFSKNGYYVYIFVN